MQYNMILFYVFTLLNYFPGLIIYMKRISDTANTQPLFVGGRL